MTDEHKLHRDTVRASNAQALLNNELLTESLMVLETEYIKKWRHGTKALDVEAREKLWQAVQIVGLVRDHLTKVLSDGKLAQAEINELAEKEKRRKIFGVV
jgi:hypothetical protein